MDQHKKISIEKFDKINEDITKLFKKWEKEGKPSVRTLVRGYLKFFLILWDIVGEVEALELNKGVIALIKQNKEKNDGK